MTRADVLEAIQEQDTRADATLLGRRTFEDFRGYWPLQTDDRTGITAQLNEVTKYVISSTMTDSAWQNSVILSGSVTEEVTALKEAEGTDIVCTGSIRLTHELLRGRSGRRAPAVRLPGGRRAWPAAGPRGCGHPDTGADREPGVPLGHHPAELSPVTPHQRGRSHRGR